MIKTIPFEEVWKECGEHFPIDFPLIIRFFPEFSVICSVGRSPFNGVLEIQYIPQGCILEFESFEEWLKSISLKSYTVESFSLFVFGTLWDVLDPLRLSISVNAETIRHSPAVV